MIENSKVFQIIGFPSILFARGGHKDMCALLLAHGANVNSRTPSNATPLHRAAIAGHHHIIVLLLTHHADPTMRDTDGMTALHKAVMSGDIASIRVLVELPCGQQLRLIRDRKLRSPFQLASTLPQGCQYNGAYLAELLETREGEC
jgi:ankyrin repeat protein